MPSPFLRQLLLYETENVVLSSHTISSKRVLSSMATEVRMKTGLKSVNIFNAIPDIERMHIVVN